MGMLEIEEVAAHFRRPTVEKTLDELIERTAARVDYGLLGKCNGNAGMVGGHRGKASMPTVPNVCRKFSRVAREGPTEIEECCPSKNALVYGGTA
jgi:hypothetical protein